MKRHNVWTLVLSLAVAVSVSAAWAAEPLGEAKTHKTAGGFVLSYRLLSPPKIEPGRKYPLVLLLHGAGERGSDNKAQLKWGVADFAKNMDRHPCFLLAPQCPNGMKWVEVDWSGKTHAMPAEPSKPLGAAKEVLDQLLKDSPVDPDRLYVTGLSMGGYGTWDALQRWPSFWAAGIPVCGGGDKAGALAMAKLPLWAFHGDKDGAVPVSRSRDMIQAVRQAGGKPKYTEYPGLGHNVWTPAYGDKATHDWLFAQKRGQPPVDVPAP